MIPRLTVQQAVIIQGFTGIICAPWDAFQAELERRMGRPVSVNELDDIDVEGLFREDFLRLLPEIADPVHTLLATFKAAQDKAATMRRQGNGSH